MALSKSRTILMATVGIGLLLFGFQNCADGSFEPYSGGGASTSGNSNSTSTVGASTTPAPAPIPVPAPTPAPAPMPAPAPPSSSINSPLGLDFYVATTGNDANNGSKALPWRTIQHAVDLSKPGWVIHVGSGTYSDHHAGCGESPMVCITKSGTANAPITIVSDTKWGAKLSCNPNASGIIFEVMASYIVISGFDMTCPGVAGSYNYAIGVAGNNGYNVFSHNYAHDFSIKSCPSVGVFTSEGVGHNVYDSNVIRHAGSGVTCDQIHGIYMGLPYDVAKNNIISGIAGLGIHAYGGGVCHQTIANNTVFDNSNGGILVEDDVIYHPDFCGTKGVTDYQTVINNISFNNGFADANGTRGGWSGVNVYGSSGVGTHNIVSNNIAFGNSVNSRYPTQCTITGGTCVNTMSATPVSLLVNYQTDKNWAPLAAYNYAGYSLIAGSSAIDKGVTANAPLTDFNSKSRPQGQGIDIGAFEWTP